jgi:hypothetical protein
VDDGKAATKASSSKKKDDSFEELARKYPQVAEMLATQQAQAKLIMDLEARVGALEIAAPATMRAMSFEEIESMIKKDINFDFEVLEAWTFVGETFVAGRVVRASFYRDLLQYVKAGLKLGKPMNGGALNDAAAAARIRAGARNHAH